jgi:hypothetical protein
MDIPIEDAAIAMTVERYAIVDAEIQHPSWHHRRDRARFGSFLA